VIAGGAINDRQRLVLNRLLDGYEGKLATSKYAKLAQCSQDTALRDVLFLVERGILVRNPQGGRSTSYGLAMAAPVAAGAKGSF
jgi:Fic family protein